MEFLKTRITLNVLRFVSFCIRGGLLTLALANPDYHAAAADLTNVFYLGDSYLDDGNYKALTNKSLPDYFSNSAPWGTLVNRTLGLLSAARWIPTGSHSPLGNNYAVSGAGINQSSTATNTSFHAQVTQLLADYPHGLPNSSLVVIAIGTNDVIGVVGFGGRLVNSIGRLATRENRIHRPCSRLFRYRACSQYNRYDSRAEQFSRFFLPASAPIIMALTQVNPAEDAQLLSLT